MNKIVIEALERSKEKLRQLNKTPSVKEWTKIAKEENLLTARAIYVLTDKRLPEFYKEAKK